MSDVNDRTIRATLTAIASVLTVTGLKQSPSLFTPQAIPLTCVDSAYCVDMQTADTGLYREGGDEEARVVHAVTISVLKQIRPSAQFASLCDAGDVEEAVMAAMLRRSNFPYGRVKYLRTSRTPTPSREYLVLAIQFELETDWSWATL